MRVENKKFYLQPEKEAPSSKKYLVKAVLITALAVAALKVSFQMVSTALFVGAAWCLFTAAVIVLNRASKDSSFKDTLYAAAMDVNYAFLLGLYIPYAFMGSYFEPKGNPEGKPILLVNGWLGVSSNWHNMREDLAKRGLGPIYIVNVPSFRGIDTCANIVKKQVEKIKEETNRDDITLIGHSKGGLVSTYYAAHLAVGPTDVITIGSPFKGTVFAQLAPGPDTKQMVPKSPFANDLRASIKSIKAKVFNIASEGDLVVRPSSALLDEGANEHFLLQKFGHLGLLFSSQVADKIQGWIEESSDTP